MSKFTNLRDKIDDQEDRIDGWLERLTGSPHTARIVIFVLIVAVVAGLALWLR